MTCHDLPHHQPGAGRARWSWRAPRAPTYMTSRAKRYLEGMAGLWCTALGYGNEEIIEAAERQMRELSFSHMFGGKTHASAIELSRQVGGDGADGGWPSVSGQLGLRCERYAMLKLIRYHAEASGQPNRIQGDCPGAGVPWGHPRLGSAHRDSHQSRALPVAL